MGLKKKKLAFCTSDEIYILIIWVSQVAQWWRIHVPMQKPQKIWIWSLGLFPGGGNGNPLQYSCLENPMDRGAWWATVHKSQRVGHDWSDLVCMYTQGATEKGNCWKILQNVSLFLDCPGCNLWWANTSNQLTYFLLPSQWQKKNTWWFALQPVNRTLVCPSKPTQHFYSLMDLFFYS